MKCLTIKENDVCNPNVAQVRECFSKMCEANGKWSDWTPWSACKVDDDCAIEGIQTRVRKCLDATCLGNATETRVCKRELELELADYCRRESLELDDFKCRYIRESRENKCTVFEFKPDEAESSEEEVDVKFF